MLSATSTLIAAIQNIVRVPLVRAVVNWGTSYDDISDELDSFSLNCNITSDVPDEANIITGPVATEVVLGLSGRFDKTTKPSQLFSPYQAYLGGADRIGAPIDVDLGFEGANGPEFLNQFVGKVRSVEVKDDGTAMLKCLDGPESLRKTITLPTFAHIDYNVSGAKGAGADSGWAINYILRKNGYYQTFPPIADELYYASNYGSTWVDNANSTAYWQRESGAGQNNPPVFENVAGYPYRYWKLERTSGVESANDMQVLFNDSVGTFPISAGNNFFIEFEWFRLDQAASSSTQGGFLSTQTSYGSPGLALNGFTIFINTSRQVEIRFWRGSLSDPPPTGNWNTVNTGAVVPLGTPTYFAIHLAFTSTGLTYNIRIGSTTTTGSLTGVDDRPSGPFNRLEIASGDASNALSMGPYHISKSSFSTDLWRNAYSHTPNCVLDYSLNPLIVIPNVEERQPWNLLQEIAQAEQGVVLFDETGILRFINRDTIASQTTAVATLSPATSLKSISSSEAVDTVRNIVRVPANPYQIDAANSFVWELAEVVRLGPNETVNIAADVTGVLLSTDTTFVYYSGAYSAATGSGYRAARQSDGAGGDVNNLQFSTSAYPSRVVVRVTNPNSYEVWLVGNSVGEAGTPLLKIVGRLARLSENQYRYSARDDASILKYGEQTTELPENPWRQTAAAAEELGTSLLAALKDPHPVLREVQVVADPRVQLGDRVTLLEQDSLMFARDYRVVSKDIEWQPSTGLNMRLSLRDLGPATTGMTAVWTLGDATFGKLDALNGIA